MKKDAKAKKQRRENLQSKKQSQSGKSNAKNVLMSRFSMTNRNGGGGKEKKKENHTRNIVRKNGRTLRKVKVKVKKKH